MTRSAVGGTNLDIAVVDVETTGLLAERSDRVVEIAIVRLSADGEVLDEFETLINPQRDVGPTHIHGISARDIRHAPVFAEVAGDVAARLQGAVFVAHNVSFDRRFVAAEFARLGHDVRIAPALCTMRLAGMAGLCGRRLDLCCAECGVSLERHHSAIADAWAAANLLRQLLGRMGMGLNEALACSHGEILAPSPWPALPAGARALTRAESAAACERPNTFIAELVRRVSAAGLGGAAHLAPYLEVLDRALEDREVTRAEIEGLYQVALSIEMTAEQVREAHRGYLAAMAALAWSDGVLSDAEHADLRHVGALLGLDAAAVAQVIEQPAPLPSAGALPRPAGSLAGQAVCFTGELQRTVSGVAVSRAEVERLAREAGMVVKSGVSRKLDILVCADTSSQSGKARKARELGVRIMAEEAFWRALGR